MKNIHGKCFDQKIISTALKLVQKVGAIMFFLYAFFNGDIQKK